jgi:hypothetical protein
MAAANGLWRAPRIHGELKTLGIQISDRTVSRLLRKLPRRPSQTWKTFLHNHLGLMVSIDFFTVPKITMKVLFVFLALEHRRRGALHFNVTEHHCAAWTSQQIVEAFVDQDAPQCLLRDRDRIYGNEVRFRVSSLQIEEVLTAPSESLAESLRRTPDRLHPQDRLNHFIIFNARHLKRTLSSYLTYYHGSRTHLGLDQQCPHVRQISSVETIVQIPHLGGLHQRYDRTAAQRYACGRIFGERPSRERLMTGLSMMQYMPHLHLSAYKCLITDVIWEAYDAD